ncbi:MAG: hypothetical protein NDI63_10210 [Pseudobdellovibrio sp.]|nr:hypothetical protein [Pseudobdellovibrio sp.]
MKNLFICLFFLSGCATARVWVISQDEGGGVIGYQNYNSASDNGIKIKQLLQCLDHKMTYNPIRQGYSAPTAYQAYNNGYGFTTIYPLDGGSYEWGEYHYRCLSKISSSVQSITPESPSLNECKKTCEGMKSRRELAYWLTISDCVKKICER